MQTLTREKRLGTWMWQCTGFSCCLFWWTCDCRNHLKYLFLISTAGIMLPSLRGVSEDKPVKSWNSHRSCVTGKVYGFVTATCSWGRNWGLGRARACPQALTSSGRVQSVWCRTCRLRKGSCFLVLCHAEIPGPVCPAFLLGSPAA